MRRAHPIYGPLVFGKSFFHHSFFLSKPTDPRRNKLDTFNSCFDFSILIPVLTATSQLLLWLQHLIPVLMTASQLLLWPQSLYSFSTLQLLYLWLTAQGFLSSQAVNKTSKWKTINIFVDSFVLPFNVTRGNRILQPQLPFLYKW